MELITNQTGSKVKTLYFDFAANNRSIPLGNPCSKTRCRIQPNYGRASASSLCQIQNLCVKVNQEASVFRPTDLHFRPFDLQTDQPAVVQFSVQTVLVEGCSARLPHPTATKASPKLGHARFSSLHSGVICCSIVSIRGFQQTPPCCGGQ